MKKKMPYEIEFQNSTRRAWLKDVDTGKGKIVELSDLVAVGSPKDIWVSIYGSGFKQEVINRMPWRANTYYVLCQEKGHAFDSSIVQYYHLKLFSTSVTFDPK